MKKIKYISFLTILFITLIPRVNAEEKVKCVYTVDSKLSAELVVSVDDKGNFNLKSTSSAYQLKSSSSTLSEVNFQSTETNKWKCAPKLYYEITSGSRNANITELTTIEKDGYSSAALNSEKSSDGGAISEEPTNEKTMTCRYGNLTIRYSNTTFSHNKPCASGTTLAFDQEDLSKDECPEQLYKVSSGGRGGDYCSYYLNSQSLSTKVGLDEDEPILDADGNDTSDNFVPPSSNQTPELTSGCEILGGANSETVKLLSKIVKIIRLGVPILIIVLGITDFMKILFSGDDKVFKDAFAKFAKRLIIGVIIIFIPYILQLIVGLSGVDSRYGIDNFFCGIIDATSGTSSTDETTDKGSMVEFVTCNNKGYVWNSVKGVCVSGDGTQISAEDCTNSGYTVYPDGTSTAGYKCVKKKPQSFKTEDECKKWGYLWQEGKDGGTCSKMPSSKDYKDFSTCNENGYIWNSVKDVCVSGEGTQISADDCRNSGYTTYPDGTNPSGYRCVKKDPRNFKNKKDCEKWNYTWTISSSEPNGGTCSK